MVSYQKVFARPVDTNSNAFGCLCANIKLMEFLSSYQFAVQLNFPSFPTSFKIEFSRAFSDHLKQMPNYHLCCFVFR